MDYTTIRNAATKIVDNIKTIGSDISTLQNKQDIISTSDKSITNSHKGKLKIEEIGGKCEQASTTGKNLMNVTLTSQTVNGVHLTVNDDKTITANGTATADTYFTIGILQAKAGVEYIVSGCPSGGNPLSYGWYYDSSTNGTPWDYGNKNEPFTALATETKRCAIFFKQGAVLSNMIFKPMIRLASIVDDAYEPYTGGQPSPNPDYPQEIKKVVVSEIKTHGKNLLNCQGLTELTFRGVTFTPNYDTNGNLLHVEVNGTASGGVSTYSIGTFKFDSNTPCILNGCPSGGSDSIYTIYTENSAVGTDYGSGVSITSDLSANIRIGVANGVTVTNLRFYPMIRKADIEDATYEPYTESSVTLSQPIELYGIGDTQDTIISKQIKRVWNEYTIPNTISVTIYDDVDDISRFKVDASPKQVQNDANLLSEYFSSGYTLQEINDLKLSYKTCIYGKHLWFITKRGEYTSETFKKFIVGKKIYYTLEEPVTEALPFTDQLALNSLLTYDAVTYLDFDSEIEPTFKGEYGVTEMGGRVLDDLLTGLNSELLSLNDSERINALESTIVNNIQD